MQSKIGRSLGGFSAAFVVMAVALSATACGAGSASGDGTVDVGLVANLTGDAAATYGVPFQDGFEMALKEARSDLHQAGVSVKIDEQDSQSTVAGAVTGYNKLRQDNVPVVVQDSQSPLGQALAPLANDDKVTLLSGAGSELENKNGYAFRFTDLGTPTVGMGQYLVKHGARRVGAIIASDNPSFTTLAAATAKGLPDGYVSQQKVSSNDTDFSAVIANLRKANVDAVVLSVLPAQAGNILLQMKQAGGFDKVLTAGTVATSSETYTVAKSAAQGFVFPQVWAQGQAGGSTFESAYQAKYGSVPTAYGALGYQVGWVLAEALIESKKKGAVDGAAIRDAIPAASTSALVRKHSILSLKFNADGSATSTGSLATFDASGNMTSVSD